MSLMGKIAAAALLLVASFTSPLSASANKSPESLVNALHMEVLSTMKSAKGIGITGRYDSFLKSIDRYFHMPLMVSFVSSEHWRDAKKQERLSLINAARRFGAGEMAVLFSGYSGEIFRTDGTRTLKDQSVLVETTLVRETKNDVRVIYRTRKFGDQWRIIDVLLDGSISQLLKRRGEYRRTLSETGVTGLTQLLNDKADEILRTPDK